MTILRRVAVPITVLAAVGLAPSFASAARGHDAPIIPAADINPSTTTTARGQHAYGISTAGSGARMGIRGHDALINPAADRNPGTATAAGSGAGMGVRGQDALARVYDADSRVLAEGYFESTGDAFAVTKKAGDGRPYVEYRYVRLDGTLRDGTHWGSDTTGRTVRFDHDFGEGRTVTFRVCVRPGYGADSCSGTEFGENWTVGHA
ncbi:hypothetical protein AB0F81_06135 [Actinoplanes sp. NPDC024001]|uniref:hypothetical protein n=1 Tax=Actinoplanes sp. NPDC024001 TaxID=3154598 RepID=UPI0033F41CA4